MHVRGQGIYEKSLYLPLSCVVNLKLLKKVLKTNKPKATFLGRRARKYGLDLEAGTRSK